VKEQVNDVHVESYGGQNVFLGGDPIHDHLQK
jgi:hypothetical protein